MNNNSSGEVDFERTKELVDKYDQMKKSGEIKRYNEESTKKDFILPLFEALGWNTSNRSKRNDSVSAEEQISRGRVDYGFRINGIPKFFLEAKSLREENIQDNEKYVTQAIDYSWMKNCSWAVLTNFETVAVFNADWRSSDSINNTFFVLHPKDFLSDNRFKLLSKIAFEGNEIDETASKWGKKQRKNPIDKQLLQDMIHFREILSKDILKNNVGKYLTQDDIDESVQRILDRLIFIRNTEDRGLEENRLQADVRQWSSKGRGQLVKEISKVYSYYDEQYNSKLFAKNLCDDLYVSNEVLEEIIEGLNRSRDNSYRYDFSIIESDVLGNIYELYLGNILKSTSKKAKLSSSKEHKKKQGIYYTPSYIVNYIIKNTVGEYIKTHKPEEIRNMKILDPACGSGSFLIRAYKELESYWSKQEGLKIARLDVQGEQQFYSRKVEILKNNIFGVDLDPKAVEIAQLNLLLQISERKQKLPLLQDNIKNGNSLIDDPSVSDKAFKWDEEFPEIMKGGGFDVIIGNPPYIKEYINRNIFELIKSTNLVKYYQGKMDIWYIFACLSIDLLKDNGLHSFIAQNNWITNYGASILRNKILAETKIVLFLDFKEYKVFQSAEIQTMIYVLKKEPSSEEYFVNYLGIRNQNIPTSQLIEFLNNPKADEENSVSLKIRFNPKAYTNNTIDFTTVDLNKVLSKIENASNYHLKKEEVAQGIVAPQETVIESHLSKLRNPGIKSGDGIFVLSKSELANLKITEVESNVIKPFYTTNELFKYYGNPENHFVIIYMKSDANRNISGFPAIKNHLDKFKDIMTSDFAPYGLHRSRKQEFFEGENIVSLRKTSEPSFTYVDFPCYVSQTFFILKPTGVDMKLLTGILNSKIIHFWLRNKGKKQGGLLQIDKKPLLDLPIVLPKNGNDELSNSIINAVNAIINFIKNVNRSKSESDKEVYRNKIKFETDRLDTLIFELYGLDKDDVNKINKFLKDNN